MNDKEIEQEIEQEIQTKGLTAPRVKSDDIETEIAASYTFVVGKALSRIGMPAHASTDQLMLCIVVLRNGFTVIGESACVSPENFDVEIGGKVAYENAIQKVWPLLGFRLRDELARAALTDADAAADLVSTLRPSSDEPLVDSDSTITPPPAAA